MSHNKKFENESQDARRRDQHNEIHPEDKVGKKHDKSEQGKKSSDSTHKRK